MKPETASKILASLTAIVGGIAAVYAVLAAAGIETTTALQDGVTGVLGLVLIVAGIWLHPSTPIGPQSPPTP